MKNSFVQALEVLKSRYSQLNWRLADVPGSIKNEKMFLWPGKKDEDIVIAVKGPSDELQQFHRHEYFYFNYVLKGQQDMLSLKYDQNVTLCQGDIYAGQPFAGHAALPDNRDVLTICILIKPEALFQYFLSYLSASTDMVNYLLNPITDSFSQEVIHFNAGNDAKIRHLIELMVCEYADNTQDTQMMLKPLVLAFLLNVSRYYHPTGKKKKHNSLSVAIVNYISEHIADASLQGIADEFGYHPNYVSNLLRKETGKTFSEILLEQRMARAITLLQVTGLPVEKIAVMVGYSNPSNFHKAFRSYYNKSPREYVSDVADSN